MDNGTQGREFVKLIKLKVNLSTKWVKGIREEVGREVNETFEEDTQLH